MPKLTVVGEKPTFKLPKGKLTTGNMERWLKQIGMSMALYKECTGGQGLKGFVEANPKYGLRDWAGVCLEWMEERDRGVKYV